MNDLWKLDPATGYWTWISGSPTAGEPTTVDAQGSSSISNVAGALQGGMGWADYSGSLWLFGGEQGSYKDSSGDMNRIWRITSK